MKENSLADNLDQMYSTECAIEQVMQDTLNVSRRTQMESGQEGSIDSPRLPSGTRNPRQHIKGLLLVMLRRFKS